MCQVGVCNEARCSSIAIQISIECKSVLNKACTMPWCHAVVHFEVKMSRFTGVFQDDRRDRGSTCAEQAVFLPR